jgi:Bacterial PH domain
VNSEFRLARMSPLIFGLRLILLALPFAFLASVAVGKSLLLVPALLVIGIYAWVWLRFRPNVFVVRPDAIEVEWPLTRRRIPRDDIEGIRLLREGELRREVGWGARVGAGGLWGGFEWLWMSRRGIVQMYISRTDRFVWIERKNGRPRLITPEEPEAFVRAASGSQPINVLESI